MYHRYQPGSNGQFQRQSVPDAAQRPPEEAKKAPPQPTFPTERAPFSPHFPKEPVKPAPPPNFQLPFLEKLLPGIDNGDLLLLLVMLLLLSEGNEDAASVVMTLAIFLFLQ